VTKIYGVEPNKDHHEGLRKKIKEAGLSDVYVIVPVGVEELGEKWVKMGEVDSITTVSLPFSKPLIIFAFKIGILMSKIQCLCSIPTPKLMIDTLYTYIKPGGQWIIYEHVIAHSPRFIASYQCWPSIPFKPPSSSFLVKIQADEKNRGNRFHLASFPWRLLHY
jgi:hypothetical protein